MACKRSKNLFSWEIENREARVLAWFSFAAISSCRCYSHHRRSPRPRGTTSGIRFTVLGALPLYLSFPVGLPHHIGVADLLRRELLRFRRPRPAHRLPVGGGPRISTVSCPAPSTTPLTAPLRSSPGSSVFFPLLFGAAANISSLFGGFGSVCSIPSAWINAVRASPCEVSPNRAVSPGLRSSRHGAP